MNKPSVLFVGHRQNSADPDQTPQNMASDQGLLTCIISFVVDRNPLKIIDTFVISVDLWSIPSKGASNKDNGSHKIFPLPHPILTT